MSDVCGNGCTPGYWDRTMLDPLPRRRPRQRQSAPEGAAYCVAGGTGRTRYIEFGEFGVHASIEAWTSRGNASILWYYHWWM